MRLERYLSDKNPIHGRQIASIFDLVERILNQILVELLPEMF